MSYVLDLDKVDRSKVATVGGKAAHLGELSHIDGTGVPNGFCVTTAAFQEIVLEEPGIAQQINELSLLGSDDRDGIAAGAAKVRSAISALVVPDDVATAITGSLVRLGEDNACAVRSSATAEDLPTASFAGQHDTYLNVIGSEAVLEMVIRCWASLFTERAVTYRRRNDIDPGQVKMAVVVQQLLLPEVSGVLFTADPVTGNRKVAKVEAVFGLGEALVSGMVDADSFAVHDNEPLAESIGTKDLVSTPLDAGGTSNQPLDPERRDQPTLTHTQVLDLVDLGRRIEAQFGHPQDIEWCLVDGEFHVVQSRPITTLFPIPESVGDGNHVYVSVGHQQMMTDAMKPLGLSVWQMTALRPMHFAGGRLFVEVTEELSSPDSRDRIVAALGKSDPLIGDALVNIVGREGFLPSPTAQDDAALPPAGTPAGPTSSPPPIPTDPAIVTGLIERSQAAIAKSDLEIRSLQGVELLDAIAGDLRQMTKRNVTDPQSMQVIMAGMDATWWLNDNLSEWLGERNAADTLGQSLPDNVTSKMGLELLDVADVIRPHAQVVELLERVDDEGLLDEMVGLPGGPEAHDAIVRFLDRYGMRCVGEIDLTRPRWSERPSTLVPVILRNIHGFEAGEAKRRFERGLHQAKSKEVEILDRLRSLPDGAKKAGETKTMVDRLRTFAGYREYPKYAIVSRYFIYKQALLGEAERMVAAGLLPEVEDIYYLSIPEIREAAAGTPVAGDVIDERKDAFESYKSMSAPRVLTSDGEAVPGRYRRDVMPDGALVGLGVSTGAVEGRARVLHDMGQADLEPGDILVTAYTDPSWSPLFLSISGLVTEVGGLMTHGAVIAREYGLPAVVGVEHATRLIRDGQRIRVDGTDGFVEILG
ncbi:MAG: rifamycin-inactivating phosphotransferase [Microthrixaceae bacterium]